jgi:hypothetical protein
MGRSCFLCLVRLAAGGRGSISCPHAMVATLGPPWSALPRTAPLEETAPDAELVYEAVDDSWPGYDELSSTEGNCKLPHLQLAQDGKLRKRWIPVVSALARPGRSPRFRNPITKVARLGMPFWKGERAGKD